MNKKLFFVLVPIAVVVLGMIGFMQEGLRGYDAFLSGLALLKVDFDPYPFNPLIEAGRWLGVAFFFGVIYTVLTAIVESCSAFFKTLNRDTVAVHGDSVYAEMLAMALGKKGAAADADIHFYRPAFPGNRITVTVTERKAGRRLGVYLIEAKNDQGKLIADSLFTIAFSEGTKELNICNELD